MDSYEQLKMERAYNGFSLKCRVAGYPVTLDKTEFFWEMQKIGFNPDRHMIKLVDITEGVTEGNFGLIWRAGSIEEIKGVTVGSEGFWFKPKSVTHHKTQIRGIVDGTLETKWYKGPSQMTLESFEKLEKK